MRIAVTCFSLTTASVNLLLVQEKFKKNETQKNRLLFDQITQMYKKDKPNFTDCLGATKRALNL